MTFNSLIFVYFFAVVFTLYFFLKHRAQNWLLLVASYVFYGYWDWRFLGLIAFTTVVDYTCSLCIAGSTNQRARKLAFLAAVGTNLAVLSFFKYFNFFAENLVHAAQLLGLSANPVALKVLLPVGVSFYTFQSISYTFDVYRGLLKPPRNFFDYAVFISFFPQLVAGPIERATHLVPQVEHPRSITYDHLREGFWLILVGYFKKVVIADNLAEVANEVFNHPGKYHGLATMIGIYAFAFQIYGDFCGYSDIARGTAKMLGFDLMFNFRMPYFARNPQEFWRRWHISLSSWLRDYLYITLGGNRGGEWKTLRNLFLTMLIGGLWHGAAWNFIFWGAYQGILLIVHRLIYGKTKYVPSSLFHDLPKIIVMFHLTCFGWILFRVNHIGDLPVILSSLLQPFTIPPGWIPGLLYFVVPLLLLDFINERSGDMLAIKRFPRPARLLAYCAIFALILISGKSSNTQFIYFQF